MRRGGRPIEIDVSPSVGNEAYVSWELVKALSWAAKNPENTAALERNCKLAPALSTLSRVV